MTESVPYHSSLAEKPDYLQAIGLVSAEWNELELVINAGIWLFLGFTATENQFDLGRAVTTHLNLPIRLDILLSLVHEQLNDRRADERFKQIANEIRKDLSPKRNKIIHAQDWRFSHPDSPEGFIVRFKARGRVESSIEKMMPNEITEIAVEIAETNEILLDMIIEFSNRLPKTPGPGA